MKKILFLEDDSAIRDSLPMVFQKQEYKFEIFSNAKQILQKAFTIPDLFIIDHRLSGVQGLDVCRFLKSQPETANIPVVIISADPTIREHSISAGAVAYIEKPFNLAELRAIIGKLLE